MKSLATRIAAYVMAGVLFAFHTPALAAQTVQGPLSLSDAIDLALQNNPEFLAQQNQLRSAEWGVRSAYGNFVPSVNASTSFGYTGTGERRFDSVVLDQQPAIYSSRYSLGMSLSLNGATLLAPSVARAQERAVEQQVAGGAANLRAEVTQRYLTALESQATAEQAERELARTELHVQLAEARFEIGSGTQLDVTRAEVQRGQAQVRLVQAQNAAANDILLLSQSIGTKLPADIELRDQFQLFQPSWTAAQLTEMAMDANPTLRASRAQADAARIRLRSARTNYLPTVSFSAGLSGYVSQAGDTGPLVSQALQQAQNSYRSCVNNNEVRERVGLPVNACMDPSTPGFESGLRETIARQNRGFPFDYITQPASASVTISMPIFNGLTREQQVAEANVARLNAEHQVRSQEIRVEVEIETALRNLQTAYETAVLQQRVREMAAEELRLAEERFRFGANTSIEVTDAQASLAEAERAEIAAIYNFHRSIAALEARVGEDLSR